MKINITLTLPINLVRMTDLSTVFGNIKEFNNIYSIPQEYINDDRIIDFICDGTCLVKLKISTDNNYPNRKYCLEKIIPYNEKHFGFLIASQIMPYAMENIKFKNLIECLKNKKQEKHEFINYFTNFTNLTTIPAEYHFMGKIQKVNPNFEHIFDNLNMTEQNEYYILAAKIAFKLQLFDYIDEELCNNDSFMNYFIKHTTQTKVKENIGSIKKYIEQRKFMTIDCNKRSEWVLQMSKRGVYHDIILNFFDESELSEEYYKTQYSNKTITIDQLPSKFYDSFKKIILDEISSKGRLFLKSGSNKFADHLNLNDEFHVQLLEYIIVNVLYSSSNKMPVLNLFVRHSNNEYFIKLLKKFPGFLNIGSLTDELVKCKLSIDTLKIMISNKICWISKDLYTVICSYINYENFEILFDIMIENGYSFDFYGFDLNTPCGKIYFMKCCSHNVQFNKFKLLQNIKNSGDPEYWFDICLQNNYVEKDDIKYLMNVDKLHTTPTKCDLLFKNWTEQKINITEIPNELLEAFCDKIDENCNNVGFIPDWYGYNINTPGGFKIAKIYIKNNIYSNINKFFRFISKSKDYKLLANYAIVYLPSDKHQQYFSESTEVDDENEMNFAIYLLEKGITIKPKLLYKFWTYNYKYESLVKYIIKSNLMINFFDYDINTNLGDKFFTLCLQNKLFNDEDILINLISTKKNCFGMIDLAIKNELLKENSITINFKNKNEFIVVPSS